jgi:thioredoxin reductase
VKRELDFAVEEGKIRLLAGTVVRRIGPLTATLQPVRYTGVEDLWEGTMDDYEADGEPFEVPCRFGFALLGHRADMRFLREIAGIELQPDGRPVADEIWETTVPGVFVAGSLCHPKIDIVLKLREQSAGVIRTIAGRFQF